MSEINAIATNNFILHNIDAKKLYVQEPLFTANSGDAVYVGWRPDETVLWENTAWPGNDANPGVNTANLSESIYNFDSIKIYGSRNSYNSFTLLASNCNEFDTSIMSAQNERCILYNFFLGNSNGQPFDCWTVLKFNNGTSLSEISGGQKPLTGSIDTSRVYYHPYKIVGINRKENA
jgi:hypothetical protein